MFPEGVPGRRLFAELAAIVLPKGYATLRYDKRASGESEGVYEATDMTVLAKDLGAAIAYARKRLPGVPVGIVAQSEGGLTFVTGWPLGVRPDFAVLQAPALEDFDLQFQFQKTRTAKPFLENPDFARRYPYVVAFYKDWESGALLRAMEKPGDRYTLRLGEWSHETNLEKYRQYRTDGLPVLRKVDVPVVILMGTEDQTVRRVPLDAIVAAKREGAFPNVTVRFLDGLEHSFREYDPNDSLLDAMAKPVSPRYETALLEALGRMAP
jgi:alpha-beta hydrolase superfamily lysophospholipase